MLYKMVSQCAGRQNQKRGSALEENQKQWDQMEVDESPSYSLPNCPLSEPPTETLPPACSLDNDISHKGAEKMWLLLPLFLPIS